MPEAAPRPRAMRIAVGLATLGAASAVVGSVVGFAAGARTLPGSYAVAALAAGASAVWSSRLVWCLAGVAAVAVVAIADAGTRSGRAGPPPAVRTWADPAGVAIVPLPDTWLEETDRRLDGPPAWLRQYAPTGADPDTAPHLQVSVMRTPNDGRAALESAPGLELCQSVQRGPARGHRWRRVDGGVGEVGLELHHSGWRIYVHLRAGLESRLPGHGFADLCALGERICDGVVLQPRTWFERCDREWFGR